MKSYLFTTIFLFLSIQLFSQLTIEGTVTDSANQEPLIGVTVIIKGTTLGTITGVNGDYLISSDLINENSVIVFSYVGYGTIEKAVGNSRVMNVSLSSEDLKLDEIVVIGYGTTKRRNVLGAVSNVSTKELTKIPSPDIAQAMQGRISGVQVTQNTGAPGEGVSVRIRGAGSINSSNDPLYIVDGIPTSNALQILSPADIESFTVLKDASAAAIYGSRANNGVVLITTRQGTKGKPRVEYRGQTGFQQAIRLTKMVNTKDYVTIYNEAASNDNAFLPPALQRSLISEEMAAGFADVNYVKKLLQTAPINSHEISLSGGNESSVYMLSASYFDQKGIIRGSGYSKATLKLDVKTDVNKWLSAGINMMAGISDNDIIGSSGDGFGGNGGSVVRYAFFRNPAIPVKFDNGSFIDRPAEYFGQQIYDSYLGDGYNPLGMSYYNDNNRKENIYLGKVFFSISLSPKIKFTTNAGVDYLNSFSRRFNPTWGTLNRINAKNSLNIGNESASNMSVNNLLNYESKVGEKGNLSLMLGFEAIKNTGKGIFASDSDFPIQQDELIFIGNGVGNKITTQNEYASTLASFFGRAGYDYLEKYYISGTLRRDGSSRFAGDNKWGTFYSLSAGWLINREQFLETADWLKTLKLRFGYGAIGNQEIGLYAYSDQISPFFNYPFGGVSNPGYAQTGLGNKNLKWETSYQYNAGIDIELGKGEFAFSVDAFYKVTEDMLVKAPNPPSVGYAESAWINSGSVLNSGLEFEAIYRKNKVNWNYSVSANLAVLHNEVLKLDAPLFGGRVESGIYATRTEEGHPIGSFYLLEMDGIFQNPTDVLLSAYQGNGINPGDVKFVDHKPDGRIDNQDRVYLGSAIPKLTGGLNFASAYKNLDLSLFFQGSFGNKIYMQINQDIEGFYRGFTVTQRYFDERWTGEGTSDTQPRASWISKSNNARPSSRFLEDGSYLRLKNLQLGYTIPSDVFKNNGLSLARIYISATNLLTLTPYPGLDPEMTVSDNSKTEGDLASGIDWGTYPSAMTIMLGINITF